VPVSEHADVQAFFTDIVFEVSFFTDVVLFSRIFFSFVLIEAAAAHMICYTPLRMPVAGFKRVQMGLFPIRSERNREGGRVIYRGEELCTFPILELMY
jgi:hypothetical protein